MIPTARRGLAYGFFNTVFGMAWFLGSTTMRLFYEFSVSYVIFFSIMVELISIPLLLAVVKRTKSAI